MRTGENTHSPGQCSPEHRRINATSGTHALGGVAVCIGANPTCPCQDGLACHYRDSDDGTNGWPLPADQWPFDRPPARAAVSGDWLDSKDFYELMQAYRWADRRGDAPAETVAAFEAVKDYVRKQKCCADGPQWGHAWDCPKCPD
jgi:hypothetical protein